jgi:hypothetical protein
MRKILRYSFFHALGVAAYIILLVSVMFNIEKFVQGPDNILAPIAMLLLFVLSAAVTGSLVLVKPIMMYLNGEKADALKMFLFTLGWLFVFVIIFFLLLSIR